MFSFRETGIASDSGLDSGSGVTSGSGVPSVFPGTGQSDGIVSTYQWECKFLSLDQFSNLAVQSAFTSAVADDIENAAREACHDCEIKPVDVTINKYDDAFSGLIHRFDGIFVEFKIETHGSQTMLLSSDDAFSALFAHELASSADPVASALGEEQIVWTQRAPPTFSLTYQWECKFLSLNQFSNLAVQSAFTSAVADDIVNAAREACHDCEIKP